MPCQDDNPLFFINACRWPLRRWVSIAFITSWFIWSFFRCCCGLHCIQLLSNSDTDELHIALAALVANNLIMVWLESCLYFNSNRGKYHHFLTLIISLYSKFLRQLELALLADILNPNCWGGLAKFRLFGSICGSFDGGNHAYYFPSLGFSNFE